MIANPSGRLAGAHDISNHIKPRAIALGYELLPLQGVRRLQTTISQIVKRL